MAKDVSRLEQIVRNGYGWWLKELRTHRAGGKLTQKNVAAGIEKEEQVVGRLERGKAKMTEKTFIAILVFFRLTPSEAFRQLLPMIEKAEAEFYSPRDRRARRKGRELRNRRRDLGASARSLDWWRQALRDLEHADSARRVGHFEWAAFAAHQAAEKAARALVPAPTPQAMDHTIISLLKELPRQVELPDDVAAAAMALGQHYRAARYPDALPTEAPRELYREQGASAAIEQAHRIVEFCEDFLPRVPDSPGPS